MSIKVISIFLFILLQQDIVAQFRQIEFTGYVNGIQSGIVELLIEPSTDSNLIVLKEKKVSLINGTFKITGGALYPYPTRIIINDSIVSNVFFIEPGKIKGNFLMEAFGTLTPKIDSKANNEYLFEYQKLTKRNIDKIENWYKDYDLLSRSYNQKIPIMTEDSMQALKLSIHSTIDSIIYQYIRSHRYSYVAMWDLLENVNRDGYNKFRYKSFFNLGRKMQKTYTGLKISRILENSKKVLIGSIFPQIQVVDSVGKTYQINKMMLSKFTLIDFWFSHCGPCISQFPELKKNYLQFKNTGFQILGISVDKLGDKSDMLNVVKNYDLTWPQFWDVNEIKAADLGITRYPTNFLLDKNGKILAIDIKVDHLNRFLEKNL